MLKGVSVGHAWRLLHSQCRLSMPLLLERRLHLMMFQRVNFGEVIATDCRSEALEDTVGVRLRRPIHVCAVRRKIFPSVRSVEVDEVLAAVELPAVQLRHLLGLFDRLEVHGGVLADVVHTFFHVD